LLIRFNLWDIEGEFLCQVKERYDQEIRGSSGCIQQDAHMQRICIHPSFAGQQRRCGAVFGRKDPLPLDPALLAPVAFDSMVLGKLVAPLLLFFMICDTTVIEPWLCCVPAIKPMILCVHLVVLSSHGCAGHQVDDLVCSSASVVMCCVPLLFRFFVLTALNLNSFPFKQQ
jgi:hypothetical protein